MSGVYNKEYYDNYDVGIGKVDYSTNDDLKFLFEVVAALRDRGMEAY